MRQNPKRKISHKGSHKISQKKPSPHKEARRGECGKQILFGLHSCLAALENPKRQGHCLSITKKTYEGLSSEQRRIIDNRVSPIFVDPPELEGRLAPGDVHQGILLEVSPLESLALEDLVQEASDHTAIVLLDQITDPHNVGAILRSAAVFGAAAIVMPQYHSAGISGTLAKCASGALEHVPIVTVGNLKQAMEFLKSEGFWCVGLDECGEKTTQEFSFEGKTALVLGAEGKGLRRLTRETCDVLLRLPTSHIFHTLNVSNAAAVALYEVFCQLTSRRKIT